MLTVIQEPQDISPAYNDLIVLASSTHYASGDFRFIAEVKNGSGTSLAKLKMPVLYGTDKGAINVKRIIESYVTYDFDIQNTVDNPCPSQNSVFNYKIELGDEYLGTEYTNQVTINDWAWNAAMTRRDFSGYASGDWVCNSGTTAKFLTNQRSKRIKSNQWDWLYFVHYHNPFPFDVYYVRYRSYNASGLLKTVDVNIITTTGLYQISRAPSGRNVNLIDNSEIKTGTAPIIHAAATYYTMQVYDLGDNPVSEAYTLYLLDDCTRFASVNIYYLNPMGGFDSFCFNQVRNEEFTPERKQLKRDTYELGAIYAKNLNKHELVNYDTKETQRVVLNSDWLTDLESQAMHELISSPVVFMHVYGDSFYTPVTVLNDKWEQKETTVEELFNCTLTVQMDSERLQRG